MLGVIVVISPALIGALIALAVCGHSSPSISGWKFIVAGVGGILGFIFLGGLMSAADLLGVRLLGQGLDVFFTCCLALTFIAFAYRTWAIRDDALSSGPKNQIEVGWLHIALLLGNLTVISAVIIQGYLLPLSSWDAFSYFNLEYL